MKARDYLYIEDRLAAPCVPASEAYERLYDAGHPIEARELMEAMQTFTDACREIRHKLKPDLTK